MKDLGFTQKPERKTHLVIAGTFAEFNNFCDERLRDFEKGNYEFSGVEFIYYSYPESVRGYKFDDVHVYGTYRNRKDIDFGYINSRMIKDGKWIC